MKFIFDSDIWQEIYGGIRKNKQEQPLPSLVFYGVFFC